MFDTRCFRKMFKDRQHKTFQNTQQYPNSYVHTFSYYLVYSTKLLSELYRLPRCIAPYKQPLNNLRDAFINAKKLTLHFTNPLVNVPHKFYVVSLTSRNFNF